MENDIIAYGCLPVKVLADQILNYFQRVNKDFPEQLDYEIRDGLKSEIVYDNTRQRINTLAEISIDGEISVSEVYLAFLWCFSYASVTYYHERHSTTFNPIIEQATKLLDYGISLFKQWSPWDLNLPNPEKTDPTNPTIAQANAVMIVASAFVLCHEFAHKFFNHLLIDSQSSEELKQDEFIADDLAVTLILNGINDSNRAIPGYEHSLKLGIIIGICSLLFVDSTMDGGDNHPNIDERIYRVVNQIGSESESEYWAYAAIFISLWELTFSGKITPVPNDLSPKESYEWLTTHLQNM